MAEPETILPMTANILETDIPVIDIQHAKGDISYHNFEFENVNAIANPRPLASEYVIPTVERLILNYHIEFHEKGMVVKPAPANVQRQGLGYQPTPGDQAEKPTKGQPFRCTPIKFVKPGAACESTTVSLEDQLKTLRFTEQAS
ncbi:hypothetical protein PJP10_31220, partial [Mycobacterium kansasii]